MHDERKDVVVELQQVALRVSNAQTEAASGTAFANYKHALQEHCPPELIDVLASIGNTAADAVKADEHHEERRHEREMETFGRKHRTRSAVVGVVGLVGMVALALAVPEPTAFQETTFRLARALCGAAIAGGLSGQLKVEGKHKGFAIQATSAVGAGILFYVWP